MITEPPEMPTVMDPQIGRMTGKKLGQFRVIIIVLKDELALAGFKRAPLIGVGCHIGGDELTTEPRHETIISQENSGTRLENGMHATNKAQQIGAFDM